MNRTTMQWEAEARGDAILAALLAWGEHGVKPRKPRDASPREEDEYRRLRDMSRAEARMEAARIVREAADET